jgi:hypothetical protein
MNVMPIIAGNVESVLALGPSDPKNITEWTIIKANTIALFLQIVKFIYNSNWLRTGLSISCISFDPNIESISQPSVENTCSVLVFFRQIYSSKDKLFENACRFYIEHSDNVLKTGWITERMNVFNELLKRPPFPFNITEYSTKEFIDVFLYGSGLIHPIRGNLKPQNKLRDLINKYGKEKVAFTIHSCFRQLLGYSIDIYHVIKRDFGYWINEKGLTSPNIIDVYDLFKSSLRNK